MTSPEKNPTEVRAFHEKKALMKLQLALTAVLFTLSPDIDRVSILSNGAHTLDLVGTPAHRLAKLLGIEVHAVHAESDGQFAETKRDRRLMEKLKERLAQTQTHSITSLDQIYEGVGFRNKARE